MYNQTHLFIIFLQWRCAHFLIPSSHPDAWTKLIVLSFMYCLLSFWCLLWLEFFLFLFCLFKSLLLLVYKNVIFWWAFESFPAFCYCICSTNGATVKRLCTHLLVDILYLNLFWLMIFSRRISEGEGLDERSCSNFCQLPSQSRTFSSTEEEPIGIHTHLFYYCCF